MGCSYLIQYTVKIRPDAVEALQAAIGADDDLGDCFSLSDGVLSCEAYCDSVTSSRADLIEDFSKGAVSAAADGEAVLRYGHFVRDGDESCYGIGPEADKALSAHRLGEINRLVADLTAEDRLVLFNNLGWTDSPS